MTRAALLTSVRRLLATLLSTSRATLITGAVVSIGLTITEGFGLLLLLPLLQLVGVDAGTNQASGLTSAIARGFGAIGLQPTLASILGVYVAVAALQSLMQRWQNLLVFDVQFNTVVALRARVYRAIASTEWSAFARMRASDLTHVLTTEIDRYGFAAYCLVDLFAAAVLALVYLALAFRLSPGMTGIVVGCGLVLAWLVRSTMTHAHQSGQAISTSRAALQSAIAEHLGGMKMAKSYGATDRHVEIFGGLSRDVRMTSRRSVVAYTNLRQSLALGSLVALAGVVYVSRVVFALPTGPLLVLLFLFARLMPRLTGLYEKSQSLLNMLPSVDVVSDLERQCRDAAEPQVAPRIDFPFEHDVRVEGVTFRYRAEDGPAVADVDLVIARGRTTAIVGPSGSGKSTIADLLLGLLTPSEGVIRVDGKPLGPDGLAAWRRHIGYVAQDTFVFHDTIRANLLWAQPNASEADLWQALQRASADAFVAALPKGLDSVVGDRGVLMSGGERQRLALARALIRQPSLLVLDEATSALDSENESRVQRAIDGLRHNQTIVIITHRLSAIRNVDVVYVLDQGRIVESGTWQELLARQGRFRVLCEAQGLDDDPR